MTLRAPTGADSQANSASANSTSANSDASLRLFSLLPTTDAKIPQVLLTSTWVTC